MAIFSNCWVVCVLILHLLGLIRLVLEFKKKKKKVTVLQGQEPEYPCAEVSV